MAAQREGMEESLELQRRVEGMRKKSELLFLEEGKKRGITFSLTTKIFDPKIKTYQRTSVGMTFSHLLLILKWNHLSSCPK